MTYGYFGTAVGLGDVTLYWGGGVANLHSIQHPGTNQPPYYGDEENDHWMTKKGIEMFNVMHSDLAPVYDSIPWPF